MMYNFFLISVAVLLLHLKIHAQTISHAIPQIVHSNENYVFYFHGGIVTTAGDNAINPSRPEWGRYEYRNILDSLRKRGFNVISENRNPATDDNVYVIRLAGQVDSLLSQGCPVKNILIIGASAGWEIVLRASARLNNPSLKYVIMGGCWPDTYKEYVDVKLVGHFLSIIEKTDPHGTCSAIFNGRKVSSYREIMLNTGLSHGFLYRGLKEWIDPVTNWFEQVR